MTPRKPKRPPTRKVRSKEAHVFWLDLSALYSGYAVWKDPGAKKLPPVCVGRIDDYAAPFPEMESEFNFSVEELEGAFADVISRKKTVEDGYGELGYGDPAEVGRSGISFERQDRYEYAINAPCGEQIEVRAGELRALVGAVRDLPVSDVAV